MKLIDLIQTIWNNMWRRRARTILTMTGVIIGSIAIFVIVSIGNGFQNYMNSQLSSMGDGNVITTMPFPEALVGNLGEAKKYKKVFNDKTVKLLSKYDDVKYCIPKLSTAATLKYKKNEMSGTSITGMEMKNYSKDHELFSGKFPSDASDECVIGYKLAQYLINKSAPDKVTKEQIAELVRKKVQVSYTRTAEDGTEEKKETSYKISGIAKEGSNDYGVQMPLKPVKEANEWISKQENTTTAIQYSQVDVVITNTNKVDAVQKKLTKDGYYASSFKQVQETIGSMLSGVKLVVGAIGAISLLVAAFGIANTMNMSIYERKKEIGVMKVIGAGLWDVKKIFIGEASAIGLLGGIVGVAIGFLINIIVNQVLKSYMSTGNSGGSVNIAEASIGLTAFVLAFSAFVGFLSGLYPASKAAKLNVINSIKDE
ncbi:MAG: ABC transporter permease [Bacillota bacterium]|nr:ABC transporter permease [Bacillota bacterium]